LAGAGLPGGLEAGGGGVCEGAAPVVVPGLEFCAAFPPGVGEGADRGEAGAASWAVAGAAFCAVDDVPF